MRESVTKSEMLTILATDADQIKSILSKQRNFLCMSKCPAFEEVADTQIYGFSCEVRLAEKCGLISSQEGKQMVTELEQVLSDIYVTAGEDD
ncbi:DUF1507 family protein [Liquorilactobacillus vini]|nr:DUF1507 family protein [Liquorilactobacillus vini]